MAVPFTPPDALPPKPPSDEEVSDVDMEVINIKTKNENELVTIHITLCMYVVLFKTHILIG